MENIICPITKNSCSMPLCNSQVCGYQSTVKSSGSVAAPKEEKSEDFGKLKWKVGQILAEQFLKYNDGKFIAAIELNPATHALTEFIESENTALREALKELIKFADIYIKSKVLEYARGNFEKSELEESCSHHRESP